MIQSINAASPSRAESSTATSGMQSSLQGKSAAEIKQQFDALSTKFSNLSVSVSPAFLEKMATDPAAAAKGEELLNGIPAAQKWLQNRVSAAGSELVSSGMTIDDDGNMSSWSVTRTTVGSDKSPLRDSEGRSSRKHVGDKADSAWMANRNLLASIEQDRAEAEARKSASNEIDILA